MPEYVQYFIIVAPFTFFIYACIKNIKVQNDIVALITSSIFTKSYNFRTTRTGSNVLQYSDKSFVKY